MRTDQTFDLETFTRGHEARDASMLLDMYADDAEIMVVDKLHPPSHPMVLRGLREIGEYLRDLCERDMSHEITDSVVADDHAAAVVMCRYADGTRVVAADTFQLGDDGRIHRETLVQAWDEEP
jgi:ketosteroid isomerase-like protein